jgi:hypothetical protein
VPSFQLNPGVIVDPDRREAYVMSPQGGIDAVDLGEGTPVWHSSEADKPLTVSGTLLIGQAEAPGPANALRIVTLDTSRGGEQVSEAVVGLPPGVQPTVAPSRNQSFTASARAEPEGAVVSWEFVEQRARGVADGPMEVLPGEAPPAASAATPPVTGPGAIPSGAMDTAEPGGEATVVRGAARVDPLSGTVTATEEPVTPAPGAPPVAAGDSAPASDLEPDAALPGVPQPQFLSADGRHVLSSQRVADDPEWDKYQWTIFERESGRRAGEIRTHLRYAPFFVDDTRVIYQTPPFARRQGQRMVQEPLQIRAADLSTGAPVWSQPMRDTVDREPPPP